MKKHTEECHSKYITWGGGPRPCNCNGPASIAVAAVIALALTIMLVVAFMVTK